MARFRPLRRAPLRIDALLGAVGGALAVLVGGVVGILEDQPLAAVGVSALGAASVGWAIYRQLRTTRGPERVAGTATAGPAAQPGRAAAWNVPLPVLGFTGRDDDLLAIDGALAGRGQIRMVAIVGLGGMGKTQLALRYAAIQAETGEVSVGWMLNASSRGYVLDGLARLGATLGMPESPDVEVSAARALAEVGRRPGWLLVYDDAKDQETVDGLIPLSGPGRAIITTRHADWRGAVEPLAVDELDDESGANFLQARTRDDDHAAAVDLAHRLGGLPLALEQAAAYCRNGGIRLRDYLRRFEASPNALLGVGHPHDLQPVTRTWLVNLAAVRNLDRAAVDLLSLLAFVAPVALPRDVISAAMPGTLPRRLRRAVRDESSFDGIVRALTNLSLLVAQPDGLYAHALVQEVMRQRIARSERWRPLAWSRHRWIEAQLRTLTAEFPGEGHTVNSWQRCAVLRPHVEAALFLSAQLGPWSPAAAQMAHLLGHYLRDRGEYAAAHDLFDRAVDATARRYGRRDHRCGYHINCLAWTLQEMNRPAEARELYEQLLDGVVGIEDGTVTFAAAPESDDLVRLMYLHNLARSLHAQGELRLSRAINERVFISRSRLLGIDHPDTIMTMNNLGLVMVGEGDLDDARELLDYSLEQRRRTYGDHHPETLDAMDSLAWALRAQGDLNGAGALFGEELAARRRILGDDHPRTLIAMKNLADALADLGDEDQATRLRGEHDRRTRR